MSNQAFIPERMPSTVGLHYTVVLPDGSKVLLADKESADALCRFLNQRHAVLVATSDIDNLARD